MIEPKSPKTAKEWCEAYGVDVNRGVATLFKVVDPKFRSAYGTDYTPGSKPKASDWDGGKAECGGGLHFSPSPAHALAFRNGSDARFVACPVKVSEIVVDLAARMPQKVKAPRVSGPTYEVDIHGNRL